MKLPSAGCGTRVAGWTIIELMIVVVIIGILAAIALPGYKAYVERSTRAEAYANLNEIAQRLERCASQYGVYNHANCAARTPAAGLSNFYAFGVTSTAEAYTVTAKAVGGQATDKTCAVITLDSTGLKRAQNTDGDDTSDDCW